MKLLLLSALCVGLAAATRRDIGAVNEGLVRRYGPALLNVQEGQQWFTSQRLDHFDGENHATWSQRYFVNTTNYRQDGPVFFVLGGEGPISAAYVGDRFITGTWAPKMGAMIVSLEHRFYGQSMPTPDTSTENLRFLSSQQALADAVMFRQYFAQKYNTGSSPWIVFGGSYPGNLAAWARLKFPHLFAGAFASSAPVLAQDDYPEYLQVVSDSLGAACSHTIGKVMAQIEEMFQSSEGRSRLASLFNGCDRINTQQDFAAFLESATDPIAAVVQYHKPNWNAANNIDRTCSELMSAPDTLEAYARIIKRYYAGKCTPSSWNNWLRDLNDTGAWRSWYLQTCLEFGYYQTGSGANQPFSPRITLEFFRETCRAVFGNAMPPTPYIDWINTYYGGLAIRDVSSNIFYGNGIVDPWYILGVLPSSGKPGVEKLPRNSAIVLIDGTSHCADLYAPAADDLPGLVEAREIAWALLQQWIN